jgi:TldD protein
MEEMIAETGDGFCFDGFKTVSIDDKRLNFNLGPEIGWVIKGGKKEQMVKGPVFTGISYKTWRSCDWVGGEEDWVLWGESRCGKGEPMQVMKVGHGTPPVRFKSVEIGARI